MSINIDSKLMVGDTYRSLCNHLTEDQIEWLDTMLDDGEIHYCSPYYDSERKSWWVGFEVQDCATIDVIINRLHQAVVKFHQLFEYEPVVFAMQDVT